MGTRLYPLPGGDEDETKVWYSLYLGMRMNFFYGNGYGIANSSSPHPVPLSSLIRGSNVNLVRRASPQVRHNNKGRAIISSLLTCRSLAHKSPPPAHTGPLVCIKKKFHLCISITFLLDFCMKVPNSCMTGKDKHYVFLNVLKFEEHIMYVKVRIWIWWKCWIINLSSNSLKS